ncbi:MAG: MFS transporter, partial [Candidatus Saccharibacteria bacterium]|nr:MFS transporter [Candidatus Saccharibacteria bacterium]
VPVGIAAFAIIAIFCPPLKHDKKPVVDYAGAALLTLALGTLVLAVDNTDQIFKGLLDNTSLSLAGLRAIMYTIVAVSVAAFVMVERRAKEPIIPLRFFRNRNYVLIMGIATLFGAAFLGSILYLTQFNQQVFGATPTQSGLMLLPMVAGLMTTAITSGQLISRTGRYKIFMQVGIVTATIMVAMLTTLTPHTSYAYEAVLMVMLGAGLGVVMPVMNLAVQNEFEQHDLGVATSSSQLFRSLGSTIGIAIFGAILTAGLTASLAGIQDDAYLQALKKNPQASKIADFNDSNTLLTLNMPDLKSKITDGFNTAINSQPNLPAPAKQQATENFKREQSTYSDKITSAFS